MYSIAFVSCYPYLPCKSMCYYAQLKKISVKKVCSTARKMLPPSGPVICSPKTPKRYQPMISYSSRKLLFFEGFVFLQKYSNGPGVTKR